MLKDTGQFVIVTEWKAQWNVESEEQEKELTEHITKQVLTRKELFS